MPKISIRIIRKLLLWKIQIKWNNIIRCYVLYLIHRKKNCHITASLKIISGIAAVVAVNPCVTGIIVEGKQTYFSNQKSHFACKENLLDFYLSKNHDEKRTTAHLNRCFWNRFSFTSPTSFATDSSIIASNKRLTHRVLPYFGKFL